MEEAQEVVHRQIQLVVVGVQLEPLDVLQDLDHEVVVEIALLAAYEDQGMVLVVRVVQVVESLVDESGLYHREVVNAGQKVQLVPDTSLVVDYVWEQWVDVPTWNELA